MSDPRWLEVEKDAATAADYLGRSVLIYRQDLEGPSMEAFTHRMAFMHAVQAGHTSLEAALVRILEMLDEPVPTGERWHRDLIAQACRAVEGEHARPAILSSPICQMIDETRQFRNLAVRAYQRFSKNKAADTVAAARFIAEHLSHEIAEFKRVIDPD